MAKQKIQKNVEVEVIAGSHKGATGKILSISKDKQKVIVDKVNIVKKHNKPTQQNPDGGIQELEAPIHISNVKISSKKSKKDKKDSKKKSSTKVVLEKENKKEVPKPATKELVKPAAKKVVKPVVKKVVKKVVKPVVKKVVKPVVKKVVKPVAKEVVKPTTKKEESK
ncbi:50S ribosomal protein L24 [Candidatus Mycoplasma mahonii]|uniref:50S ribosomal protein L24 n=1 Tax=Candidatus Mycoplasma mahonii TaxID=3004105 RepID=UPI0026E91EEC|nr:50S ribosomal protein L24 [Candidatus Mycoplasma mahonii]WKX02243.1 50S ribosomal protein L24 [Candidatus Mycoplasma mahonii]